MQSFCTIMSTKIRLSTFQGNNRKGKKAKNLTLHFFNRQKDVACNAGENTELIFIEFDSIIFLRKTFTFLSFVSDVF